MFLRTKILAAPLLGPLRIFSRPTPMILMSLYCTVIEKSAILTRIFSFISSFQHCLHFYEQRCTLRCCWMLNTFQCNYFVYVLQLRRYSYKLSSNSIDVWNDQQLIVLCIEKICSLYTSIVYSCTNTHLVQYKAYTQF